MCGSSVFGGRTSGGKKVATWASLFQTDEENFGLENSEMGQYSCTRLLKEIEALDSDIDEEISTMAIEDTEMVHLPKAMYYEILDNRGEVDLPADVYTLPDMIKPEQNQGHSVEQDVVIGEKREKMGSPNGVMS
jgi:hypothetical protein